MNSLHSAQIRVAFWNLQNLFDVEPSAMASELGFTAIHGWDHRAFEAKIANLAGVIRGMFDNHGPDLIGLAEVENVRVVQCLVDALGRDDYMVVTASHSEITATGTALIYSKHAFDEESVQVNSHLVHLRYPTCDILEVRLTTRLNQSNLSVLVNHWPSVCEPNSAAFRQTVASHCAHVIEQNLKLNRRDYVELADTELSRHQLADRWNGNVLLMGSFNDEPWARSIRQILNADYSLRAMQPSLPFSLNDLPSWRTYASCRPALFNPTWSLMVRPDQGTWLDVTGERVMRFYDQLMFSRGLVSGGSGLQVVTNTQGVPLAECLSAELVTDETGRPIPFSCDSREGFSDRLPVGLSLKICES